MVPCARGGQLGGLVSVYITRDVSGSVEVCNTTVILGWLHDQPMLLPADHAWLCAMTV